VLRRLQLGEPIVVTAIGMSNTFNFAGCYGNSGCLAFSEWRQQEGRRAELPGSVGWGVTFMEALNKSWPHPDHQFYNRAAGASNPSLATNCLASHVAPQTDLLISRTGSSNSRLGSMRV
jgi:hypothetical protein